MKITTYDLEDFSPCKSCTTRECGLVDGNECEKCNKFFAIKDLFESMEAELVITRQFIYEHDLSFELLSYMNKTK